MTSTLTTTSVVSNAPAAATRKLVATTAVAGVAASAATAAAAAAAQAAGVSVEISGEQIPPVGFAQVTLMCVALGLIIAVAIRRWAGQPRRTFTRTAVALTAVSFIPDLMASASADTKATLIATHIVAALIVIPAIRSRLPEARR